ncbi:MAG: hypothetical protein ACX93T_03315 [Bacteroidota bacterium]
MGVQATTNEAHEITYYSSDEDAQMLSSEEMIRRRELCGEVVKEIMDLGPTLGAGAAAKLAGKAPKIVKAAKGVGESAVDTAKLVVVDIPILATKFIGKGLHSLATWEDKLGIGEKITEVSGVMEAFCSAQQYAWENPREYQERVEKAQILREELDIAERALNAEAYHKRKARNIGYWSSEALQVVFWVDVIKGGAQLAKGGVKLAKRAKQTAKVARAAKAPPVAAVAKASGVMQHTEVTGGAVEMIDMKEVGKRRTVQIQELQSGKISESDLMRVAEHWLGEAYKDMGNGRYLSRDGLRQFRYGKHETSDLNKQHAHFEAYDKPIRVVVNSLKKRL